MKKRVMQALRFHVPYFLVFSFLILSACAHAEGPASEVSTLPADDATEKAETTTDMTAPESGPSYVDEEELPAADTKPEKKANTSNTPTVLPEKEAVVQPQVDDVDVETPLSETPAEDEVDLPSEQPEEIIPDPAPQSAPSHQIWDGLLSKYVSATGRVDYAGLKSNRETLNKYLGVLKDNPPRNDWSRNERMAYWINAYNAFTVKMILDNYPLTSIKDIYGGNPWDVKWIEIGDRTYSLNQIENDILRPIFKDARIHFAVNCAATSCPPLFNRAFTAAELNGQLENQTRKFINNGMYNTIKPTEIKVSKIFDWYGSDFGNLISYLNEYSETQIRPSADISFMNYDWGLNGK